MDAQGGEKIPYMERMYSILSTDAIERGMLRDEFYFLSDEILAYFKRLQEFDAATVFPGSCVQQAYLIWAQCSLGTRKAIAEANGFTMTNLPLLPGEAYFVFEDEYGTPTGSAFVKNRRWYKI
jgi:hypothetical protein